MVEMRNMCKKCEKAAKILAVILPYTDEKDENKLKEWAIGQRSTEITRIVAAYLALKQPDTVKLKNTERLSKKVIGDIRRSLTADNKNDTSNDDKINQMENDELLEHFFIWHGFIGFKDMIKNAVENIYRVKLK